MALTERHKRRFQIVTHTMLIAALALMVIAFIIERIEPLAEFAESMIYAGVIVAIVSTPLRLLGLAHMYYVQGDNRIAFSSLALVAILAGGAALKWFFL